MSNKNIRKCRYCDCKHINKEIDVAIDEYVTNATRYFHKDCYELMKEEERKEEERKKDLQFIRTLWLENISNTVVYSHLFRVLNELLDRGIEIEYLIFVVQYCIKHKLNLRYPAGLYYFVDKQEIKDAYTRKRIVAMKINPNSFVAKENNKTTPAFSVNKKKKGFHSILNE